MGIDYNDIGRRVRAARQAKGISQEKLAELVNVGTTHISHIETGNTKPSLKVLVDILNALEISADELLCDSVQRGAYVYRQELTDLLDDCTPEQARVITETVKTLKRELDRQ